MLTQVTCRLTDGVTADAMAGVDMSLRVYEHAYEPTVITVHARNECLRAITHILSLEPDPFPPTLLHLPST